MSSIESTRTVLAGMSTGLPLRASLYARRPSMLMAEKAGGFCCMWPMNCVSVWRICDSGIGSRSGTGVSSPSRSSVVEKAVRSMVVS